MRRFFKKEGLSEDLLEKLTIYMAVGTIIGARLGHCLFYQPDYYLSNPLEILKIWHGGLASHGAAIGILLALWLFVFINNLEVIPKHPTQIYEALTYFLVFILLIWLYYRTDGKPIPGLLFGLFLVLVFGMRFLIEFIKEDQVPFESGMSLNMGQWLSLPFIMLGLGIFIGAWRKSIKT